MKQIYLLYDFNPYHNRQIKKFDTVAEYLSAASSYEVSANEKNFKYSDGVNTVMPIRTSSDTINNPDYILVVNPLTQAIESRWFVLEADLVTARNYDLVLHRDVIADSYDDIIGAPAFIEKATVNPTDPFIFNQEQITVNKIKKGETLLKDSSNCAWIVGYCAPDIEGATIEMTTVKNADYVFADVNSFNSNFNNADVSKFINGETGLPTSPSVYYHNEKEYQVSFIWYNNLPADPTPYHTATASWYDGEVEIEDNEFSSLNAAVGYLSPLTIIDSPFRKSTFSTNTWVSIMEDNLSEASSQMESRIGIIDRNGLNQYAGKVFQIGTKYYEASVVVRNTDKLSQRYYWGTNVSNNITNTIKNLNWTEAAITTNASISAGFIYDEEYLQFTLVSSGDATITTTPTVNPKLNNLPYKMFAIPVSDEAISIVNSSNVELYQMTSDFGYKIANALSAQYSGSNAIYDIQLLPYCPIQKYIKGSRKIERPTEAAYYTEVFATGTTTKVGIVYWCVENNFTLDIAHAINITNTKLETIADMYRLCSPNWNGQFEFNAAKNGGVTKFNVDCTYKPYTPYIHINPDFGRLYGQDFNDARGLICAGDFSLPQLNDTWKTYETNNKNYQNEFNRQIQNLELTQDINMKKQAVGAAVGTVQAAFTGGMTGALVGGVPGAIGGAVIGGAASAAGAIADYQFQKTLNNEVIDYSRDQFGMRNENIQAVPDSLKQVGAFTANNKIYPVLEYYSCSDEEKTAIENKLLYNGMTVERIGTIAEFLRETESYIKAKLIRINIPEDNHYIEAIAQELNKGVFIK